ncbi:MAG: acyltransferase [Coriobacteriales bacterium]|nr:acyltransferase [Coriobacteriales bacterium]
MDIDYSILSATEKSLLATLASLSDKLDTMSLAQHQRLNPMLDNVLDWRKRGEKYANNNVVLFPSTVVIGDVQIGSNCWIGPHCVLDGSGGLTIGKGCTLASGTIIYTHDTSKNTVSGGKAPYEHAPTTIGDYSFIATNSTVLMGTTIGSHCVVGAGTLVNKDVADYTIVAGTPAKVIGRVVIKDDQVEYEYC